MRAGTGFAHGAEWSAYGCHTGLLTCRRPRKGLEVIISYMTYHEFPGWSGGASFFSSLIEREGSAAILEIGAGANPTLPPSYVDARQLSYTTNDMSPAELEKAGPSYETLCLDMAAVNPSTLPRQRYDFVFSRMVAEHVENGEAYYRNIWAALTPGGVTAHCFSTLYAGPFLVNHLLPESVSSRLLDASAPRDRYQKDKFRAAYSWSRGPSRRMLARLRRVGFEIEEFRGFFGHSYYDNRALRLLHRLEQRKAVWLCEHPVPALTSYAVVVLRKPRDAPADAALVEGGL